MPDFQEGPPVIPSQDPEAAAANVEGPELAPDRRLLTLESLLELAPPGATRDVLRSVALEHPELHE